LVGRHETRRRLLAGLLPGEDHLPGARPENAVGTVRVEAKRRQRQLDPGTVEWSELQRRLLDLRRQLGGSLGISLLLGLQFGLLPGVGIGLQPGLG